MRSSSDPRARPALTLDLWHTLVYLEPADEEAYMRQQIELAAAVLESSPPDGVGPRLDLPELRRTFETVYSEAVAASQRGVSVTPTLQIQQAGARAHRAVDPEAYLQGLRALVGRTPFRPAPEAVEVLAGLKGAGWATAVVSNTVGEPGASLRPILHGLGLDPVVDAWVFSDEQPWTKPAPEIFRAAVDEIGAQAARTVHIGDGWVDIEGARRAGLRAGVLYTGLQRYGERYRKLFLPPDWADPSTPYRFASWPELPALLDRIR